MTYWKPPASDRSINCTLISGHATYDIMDAGSPQLAADLVQVFVANSLAPNTRRGYASDIASFVKWGGQIPASPDSVAMFIAARAYTHAPATLNRYLAAISHLHRFRSLPDPTSSPLVQSTFRGIKRTAPYAREATVAKPLLREDLFHVIGAMGSTISDCRDRALLTLGFAAALRRSELVGLDIADLAFVNDGLEVKIRKSKTDQFEAGYRLWIASGRTPFCARRAVERWLSISNSTDGPVFRPIDRSGRVSKDRLSGEAVSLVVKHRLAAAGFNPGGYSGHSLRAGFATSAALSGMPIWAIRKHTRHMSDEGVQRYVRTCVGGGQNLL